MSLQFKPRDFVEFSLSILIVLLVLVQGLVGQTTGPSFGSVIALGGTLYDSVIDELRGRVYFVNSSAGRIDIYNYAAKRISGNIRVGTFPTGAAMSVDGGFLYVTNTQSSTLSVIDLSNDSVVQTIS